MTSLLSVLLPLHPPPRQAPFTLLRLWHFYQSTTPVPCMVAILTSPELQHHVLTCFHHLPAGIPSSESPPPHTKPPLLPTAWNHPSSLTGSDTPYPSALADACLIPSRLHAAWNYPAMQMPCLLTPSILTPYSWPVPLLSPPPPHAPLLEGVLTSLWL